MFIKQISVFIENTSGSAADALKILAENGIDIRALSIADTSEYGIMRLIVNDAEKAKGKLTENGIIVKVNDVLALPIGDVPGGLAGVLDILSSNNVAIEYMYAFVGRNRGNAVVVAKPGNPDAAVEVLSNNGIYPLSSAELF